MKKLGIMVAVALVAGVASSWAQTNAFKVSIKGTITKEDGTKVQVKDVSKNASGLVSSSSNVLVLVVDQDDNYIEVDEVRLGATNTIVRTLVNTYSFAAVKGGKFNGDLETNDPVTNFVDSAIPPMNGDLQISGTGKAKSDELTGVSGTLNGVWKDPTFDPVSAGAVFKGTLRTTGTITVPDNF